MICRLDLENLTTDDRSQTILYATHDNIVYRESNRIILGSCDEEQLSSVKAPPDYAKYEFLDLGDVILFVFNNMDVVVMDKSGMVPHEYRLDLLKVGRCITKLYPGDDPDRVVFGTLQGGRIQFVNYDFMTQQRVAQTASWKVSTITDICFEDMILYAVLDESSIVACAMSSGETLWTRFETAKIGRGIVSHDGRLVYCCQGLFKKIQNKDIQTTRIPLLSASSIEHHDDRNIYFTSNDGKNVCAYYTVTDKLRWQVFGRKPIQESIVVHDTNKNTLLLAKTDDHIAVVNLSLGKAESIIRSPNIYRLRQTSDHVLIQKNTGTTTLIPGVENDSNN
ncbi:MAG: hypothetical protein ACXAC5_11735 [Promethearchaeota archaeon]|jgi:hypothetical protein